ncbi:expressed unknown protein [Seminavis robusta]|uniref:Uncharacterized protein n=1 Tax=Seminavis robusta TaxID=568900 RepID=A0A9N8EN85_9STRA|nr:expressed unknown protein [Seminavis robusta]|eukprot:Sro1214_g253060.1 n/a (272) ;mRNA; r:23599-24414
MIKTATTSYAAPDAFLGGCGSQTTKAPRTKLRASWVHAKEGELSLESLALKPAKKPVDFMGGSCSKGLDAYSKPMEDSTEKTANSSVSGALDLSGTEFFNHSFTADEEDAEPVVRRKSWNKKKKQDTEAEEKPKSMAYALDDYLPGSEPAPIKRWTPPKKEEAEEKPKRISLYPEQGYLPGSEPAPIKRWTPPKNMYADDDEPAPKRNSLYHEDGFIGGCEPKAVKKWTPLPKDDDTEPKRTSKSSSWDQPTAFLGGCEPAPVRRWSRPGN